PAMMKARVNRMRKFRPAQFRSAAHAQSPMPIGRYIPSTLTLIGLCCGTTAIRFALTGEWKAAVIAIVLAAVFDTLDGQAARLFRADSKFGAQLDSLADLVSFGIAPSVLVYMWTLQQAGSAGWTLALIFCVCCAIRLARFNIETVEAEDKDAANAHFTGLPTPAAACLILLPMLLSFQFHTEFFHNPFLGGAMVAVMSLLMVSRVPTISLKRMRIRRKFRVAAGGFAGLLIATAIVQPWATMTAGLLIYLAVLPFAPIFLLAPKEIDEDDEAEDLPPSAP
ncbi:MAG TPA: CDP-diacylglycerol--serine O-phosphatidyltransferase, partial [Rhizomicrobium sp.]|nr:CDP-diacylglycerol--serine O-phosphatidyltransferase [Rhizomicrobium sp.]